MSYVMQNFKDGDVLTAAQLNYMEQGIKDAGQITDEQKEDLVTSVIAALPVYGGEVEEV